MDTIDSFEGVNEFLGNFYEEPVNYKGFTYNSGEHAFQAQKADNEKERLWVASGHNPYEAKKRGRAVKLRKDWESVKIQVMREILQQKFAAGTELYNKLKNTEDAKLIEGNWWGDKFWGKCNGVGENWLGRLLMEIRDSEESLV